MTALVIAFVVAALVAFLVSSALLYWGSR